jgi:hypothetical protein
MRDDTGEALKWRRRRDEKEDVHEMRIWVKDENGE